MTDPKLPGEPLAPERVAELRASLLPDAFGLLALCDSHEALRESLRRCEEESAGHFLNEMAHWDAKNAMQNERDAARAELDTALKQQEADNALANHTCFSYLGEINAARAEVAKLRGELQQIVNVLGPNESGCGFCGCDGCSTEMQEALRIAKASLAPKPGHSEISSLLSSGLTHDGKGNVVRIGGPSREWLEKHDDAGNVSAGGKLLEQLELPLLSTEDTVLVKKETGGFAISLSGFPTGTINITGEGGRIYTYSLTRVSEVI